MQADDGWTSVKYRGELLKTYRPKKQPATDQPEADAAAAPRRKKARRAPTRYTESDEDEAPLPDEVSFCFGVLRVLQSILCGVHCRGAHQLPGATQCSCLLCKYGVGTGLRL